MISQSQAISFLKADAISILGTESRQLLSPISVRVSKGERLAIVGETGSGKSTLLKSLAGLMKLDHGAVSFLGEEIDGPDKKLVPGHEEICYLSQHFELPKFITILDFLTRQEQVRVEDPELIYKACKVHELLDRDTRALSGGEKQRVALTKELLKAPQVLLLDEPFSNLDFNHKRIIRDVMDEVERELDITIVLVAHDPKDVLSWADRVMVLRKGQISQLESPSHIYNQPADAYVASLFGAYSTIRLSSGSFDTANFHMLEDQVFLRPHQVHIVEEGPFSGKVAHVRYFGSYDEIGIESNFGTLISHVEVNSYQIGQSVAFALK